MARYQGSPDCRGNERPINQCMPWTLRRFFSTLDRLRIKEMECCRPIKLSTIGPLSIDLWQIQGVYGLDELTDANVATPGARYITYEEKVKIVLMCEKCTLCMPLREFWDDWIWLPHPDDMEEV
jgi:hypothetical protein